jgi:mRNA turnover protein 4
LTRAEIQDRHPEFTPLLHLPSKKFPKFSTRTQPLIYNSANIAQFAPLFTHYHLLETRSKEAKQTDVKMPKSKRAQVVHLSRTQKKTPKVLNEKMFTLIHEAADSYPFLYILRIDNMRNTHLKDVRAEFADSRIFFGKTKVMAKALSGVNQDDEYMPGMHGLLKYFKGDVGLLFSPRGPAEVLEHFESFAPVSFAKAGAEATYDFVIPEGIVYSTGGLVAQEDDVPLPHSVEATIRKWGIPTRLDKGKVILDQEHVVCKEGQSLDSNQTSLLKFFGVAMSEFKVSIDAYWSSADASVTAVASSDGMEE